MGTERKRLKILNKLKEQFLEANNLGKGIDKENLIFEMCLNLGVRKSTATGYVQVLLDAKFIEEDLGNLWLCGGVKSQTLTPEEQAILSEKNLEEEKRTQAIMERDAALQEQGATD